MSKFKPGDKVRRIKDNAGDLPVGTVCKVLKCDSSSVYIENHGWYSPENFELIEQPKITATAIKLDSNEIKITANPIIYSNIQEKIKVLDKQYYERMIEGIWNNEQIIKKEGINMIESLNLVDLYANKQRDNIEKETKEKVEELRKKCDVINKYNELVEQFEKDCKELYLSQFTEEEKKEILINQDAIDDSDKQLRKAGGGFNIDYYTNHNFKNDEYFDVINKGNNELFKVDDLVKTVKSHVAIAKTKEEVEEILKRYEILDKKTGKLVTK